MSTMTALSFSDTTAQADTGAISIIDSLKSSTLDYVRIAFDNPSDQEKVLHSLKALDQDRAFQASVSAALFAWVAKYNIILPPTSG